MSKITRSPVRSTQAFAWRGILAPRFSLTSSTKTRAPGCSSALVRKLAWLAIEFPATAQRAARCTPGSKSNPALRRSSRTIPSFITDCLHREMRQRQWNNRNMVQIDTFGKYCIVRKLGRSMTDVYLADDTALDRRVVLKIIEH